MPRDLNRAWDVDVRARAVAPKLADEVAGDNARDRCRSGFNDQAVNDAIFDSIWE
jgi:hypothetical protein